MAQSISFYSGSPLIGTPIVYKVIPTAHLSAYTFHRTILKVYAALETDQNYSIFEFATPIESTADVFIDISSALRAVADTYEYSPTPPSRYPYIKFRLEAYDEWMQNGELHTNVGLVYYPTEENYLYAFMGGFTDLERITATDSDGRSAYRFSRKPVTPEIVHVNKGYIRPANFTAAISYVKSTNGSYPSTPTAGPKSYAVTGITEGLNNIFITDDDNNSSNNEVVQLYGINAPAESYEIRFVNGLGCLESIHVCSLRQTVVSIASEEQIIAKQETFKKFSRGIAIKKNNTEKWSLSSGPLTKDWASWFLHEFLMATWMWIKVNSNWIPCYTSPGESTTLEDRAGNSMFEIQFTVTLDINGSPIY